MVAGGDVGFGAGQFVQAGQQLAGDLADVDLVFADLYFLVGDDVGGGAGVAQGMLVVALDVIDQAFVQRPGVQLAFPVIDHRVAETEDFRLHVGHAGCQPGFFGRLQGCVGRLGEQGVDGFLKFQRGAVGVAEDGMGHVGVMLDHCLGGFAVQGIRRARGGLALGGGLRSGGLFGGGLVLAATSEGNGGGQQAGGGPERSA